MTKATLHQFGPAGELPSISPYCWKVQMALNLRKVPFEVHNTLFAKRANPRGKLPYLEWGGDKLEDSTAILRTIDRRATQGPRLVPEVARLASEAHILEDWADESLYWHGVYAKYEDESGWELVREAFSPNVPAAIRPVVLAVLRRDSRAKLRQQGLSRRDRTLVLEEFDRHLDSLETRLKEGSFLVGDAISIADLGITAMVGQLTLGLTPSFAERIDRRERLSAYLRMIRGQTGVAN